MHAEIWYFKVERLQVYDFMKINCQVLHSVFSWLISWQYIDLKVLVSFFFCITTYCWQIEKSVLLRRLVLNPRSSAVRLRAKAFCFHEHHTPRTFLASGVLWSPTHWRVWIAWIRRNWIRRMPELDKRNLVVGEEWVALPLEFPGSLLSNYFSCSAGRQCSHWESSSQFSQNKSFDFSLQSSAMFSTGTGQLWVSLCRKAAGWKTAGPPRDTSAPFCHAHLHRQADSNLCAQLSLLMLTARQMWVNDV